MKHSIILGLVVDFHRRLKSAAGPESSNGLPSDVEDGDDALLDGEDGRKASSGLASPMDEPRYRTGRGRGRGGGRGRGSRRRKAEADDDDASDIFDDSKAVNKRRKRGEHLCIKMLQRTLQENSLKTDWKVRTLALSSFGFS